MGRLWQNYEGNAVETFVAQIQLDSESSEELVGKGCLGMLVKPTLI